MPVAVGGCGGHCSLRRARWGDRCDRGHALACHYARLHRLAGSRRRREDPVTKVIRHMGPDPPADPAIQREASVLKTPSRTIHTQHLVTPGRGEEHHRVMLRRDNVPLTSALVNHEFAALEHPWFGMEVVDEGNGTSCGGRRAIV